MVGGGDLQWCLTGGLWYLSEDRWLLNRSCTWQVERTDGDFADCLSPSGNLAERAEGWDSLGDVRTVVGSQAEPDPEDVFVANDDFPEIPDKRMDPSFWSTVKMGKWGNTKEHITLKEGRALLIAVRRLSRSSSNRCKRHLILLDNLALVFSVAKGRSHSYELLRILQKIGSISLACQLTIRPRWVRSEVNVADAPSRGRIQPGSGGSKGFQSSDTAKAGSEDSQQEAASSFIEAGCAGQEEDKQLLSQCQGADSEEGIPTSLHWGPEVCEASRQWSWRELGWGAQTNRMTVLEQKSVSSEIQFQYQGYYLKLKDFSMESGLGWPLQRDVADLVLADYMDTLFLEKKAAAEGEKTLAALEFFQLELKGTLWHSRRALRGWRKCMPAQSRLPLPKVLM